MGRYREAQAHLEESLSIARSAGDRQAVAGVLHVLALAMVGQGDAAAARRLCEETLDIARDMGDERRMVMASNALAQLHRLDGQLDRAEVLYLEAAALSRRSGDRVAEAIVMLNLAMVAVGKGDDARATDLLCQVLAISGETGARQVLQSAFELAAGLAASRGEWGARRDCSGRPSVTCKSPSTVGTRRTRPSWFNVESPQPRAFSESDLLFLEIYAGNVALALNTLDLLEAQGAAIVQKGIEAIHRAVALPIAQILNNTVHVLEAYQGYDAAIIDRLKDILRKARDIRQLIHEVGKGLAPGDVIPTTIAPPPPAGFDDIRVLVVDSDAQILESAHSILDQHDCTVETARTGDQAVSMVRNSLGKLRRAWAPRSRCP